MKNAAYYTNRLRKTTRRTNGRTSQRSGLESFFLSSPNTFISNTLFSDPGLGLDGERETPVRSAGMITKKGFLRNAIVKI